MKIEASICLCLALFLPVHADSPYIRPAEAICNTYRQEFNSELADFDISKIVNAMPKEFPFVVSLQYRVKNSNELENLCAGSLITSKHVLSMANCIVNERYGKPIQAVLGTTNLGNTPFTRQDRSFGRMTVHPKHRINEVYYDIAILEMTKPVDITRYVRPICLQYEPLLTVSEQAVESRIIVDWNRDDKPVPMNQLFKSNINLLEKSVCTKHYDQAENLLHGIDDSMMCVKRSVSLRVKGGAPLLQKNNHWISLIGIASFHGDLAPGIDVFQSTYYHLDWIEKVVWPQEKQMSEHLEDQQIDTELPDHVRLIG